MSLIIRSAYLDMCRCGEHGRFVLSDGSKGPEFCSKEAANLELDRLRKEKLITEPEHRFLKDEVGRTHLPTRDLDAELGNLMMSDLANALADRRRHRIEEDPPSKWVM